MIKKLNLIKIIFPVIILFLVISIIKCTSTREKTPKYIFLITLDTTRADYIDYSLEKNTLTPHLAELASQGVYFSNAYSLIPITFPPHLSMFYSLPPHILRVYNNGEKNDATLPSLEKIFKDHGYSTGAVISLGSVSSRWGIGKDFDLFIENFRKPYLWYKTAAQVNEDAFLIIEKFKKEKSFFWIHYSDPHAPYFPPCYKGDFSVSLNGEKKFISESIEEYPIKLKLILKPGKNTLILQTEIPELIIKDKKLKIIHIEFRDFSITPDLNTKDLEIRYPNEWKRSILDDYVNFTTLKTNSVLELQNKSPENMKIQLNFIHRIVPTVPSIRILYQQEVNYMDKYIGKLVEFLKRNDIYEDSVFVIMGDHGEGLGEYRNHVGHIEFLNKTFVKVPLILSGKNIKKAGIREEVVSNLNIAPTILDIAHIKKPEFMMGQSLLKSRKKEKLLLETYAPEAQGNAFSIIDFPYQIILYPYREENKLEFINLKKDELGIQNIIKNTDVKSEYKISLLKEVQEKADKLTKNREKKPKLSEAEEEILKSLGYIK